MKISKAEKIWLIAVIVFYALYNFPFFPVYGDSNGLIFHGLFTLIPLWICVFVGVYFVNKSQPLRDEKEIAEEEKHQDSIYSELQNNDK